MSFALESVTQTSAGAGGVDVIVKGINVGKDDGSGGTWKRRRNPVEHDVGQRKGTLGDQ